MLLLLVVSILIASSNAQDGGGQAEGTPPPPATGGTTATMSPTDSPSTTTPSGGDDCNDGGGTEINFDFKGLLSGAKGGDCDCSKQNDCSNCEYGIFGYPCIADICDRCLCGGGLATPPGSACLPCTEETACADDGSTTSTCLNGLNGPCEPTYQDNRKSLFLGGTLNDTDFYMELSYQVMASYCRFQVNWASSRPLRQVRVFALQHQFGTMQGADDPDAQCFQGVRYKVVNGENTNYNIVQNSLQYDTRFALNGVPGLVYGAGSLQGEENLYFGQSSLSPNVRDASRNCPAGVDASNLPVSFKVVLDGGGIPSSDLNNFLSAANAPNSDNVGTHWVLLPDRGVCVGNPELSEQNDGSAVQFAAAPQACASGTGCFVNPGPPVFANPPSEFKRGASSPSEFNKRDATGEASSIPWVGAQHGGSP